MPTAVELGATLRQKRGELKSLFDAHRNDQGEYTHDADQITEINQRSEELNTLEDQFQKARGLEETAAKNDDALKALEQPARPMQFGAAGGNATHAEGQAVKSLGQWFVESKAYQNRRSPNEHIIIDLDSLSLKDLPYPEELAGKAVITRAAGWDPFVPRIPRVIESAQRRPVVADLIPQETTTASSVKFMEETVFTNAADMVTEGGTKPESGLQFTERTQIVEKVATWVPVTEEQIEDVPQLRSVIDNRLRLMVELKEEQQLLSGSGASPQLQGFLTKTGIQTQAKGADPVPDAIYKAFTKVRFTGFAEPTGVVMHPNDWQDVRLLRTADGLYIWGPPSEAGPERIWGKPVVVTPAITENTALTGDFQMFSQLYRRAGIRIAVSDSHGTYFIENKLAVLVEERLVLVVYRAAAFASITGI